MSNFRLAILLDAVAGVSAYVLWSRGAATLGQAIVIIVCAAAISTVLTMRK